MLAPEVVLDFTAMEGHGPLREAWAAYSAIPAVRDGRVIRVSDPVAARPGPRVGQASALLAAAARTMRHDGLTAVVDVDPQSL